MSEVNIKIGDKKTYDDWGLQLTKIAIDFPEPKTNLIDIPGADGVVDMTEALGEIAYKNRKVRFYFAVLGSYENWHSQCTLIANYLHGKRLKVILDTDPYYYYIGRLQMETTKTVDILHEIVITGDMDPYKYEMQSSLEDWLWGPFSLRTGIIRNYKNLVIVGSRTLKITGRRKPIVPTIIASVSMTVDFGGERYELEAGEQKIYRIIIREGINYLTFEGNGTISIDYRGGIL